MDTLLAQSSTNKTKLQNCMGCLLREFNCFRMQINSLKSRSNTCVLVCVCVPIANVPATCPTVQFHKLSGLR